MKKNKFIIIFLSILLLTKTNHYAASATMKNPNSDPVQLNLAIIGALKDLEGGICLLHKTFYEIDTVENLSDFCTSINVCIIRIKNLICSIDVKYKILSSSKQYNNVLEVIPYNINITKDLIKDHYIKIKHNCLNELLERCKLFFAQWAIQEIIEIEKLYSKFSNDVEKNFKKMPNSALNTLNSGRPLDNNKNCEPVEKPAPKKREETLTDDTKDAVGETKITDTLNEQQKKVITPNKPSELNNENDILNNTNNTFETMPKSALNTLNSSRSLDNEETLTNDRKDLVDEIKKTDTLNEQQKKVITPNKPSELNNETHDSNTELHLPNVLLNEKNSNEQQSSTKDHKNEAGDKTSSFQKNKRVTNISLKKILIGIVIISTIALAYVWYKKGIESGLYLLKGLYK